MTSPPVADSGKSAPRKLGYNTFVCLEVLFHRLPPDALVGIPGTVHGFWVHRDMVHTYSQ